MTSFSNLISISDLSRKDIESILDVATQLKMTAEPNLLQGKIIASLFFEASTRTRLSFESAIYRLGGQVIGFSDSGNTSFKQKGESLEDTISMINSYADAIVIRHPEIGSATRALNVSNVPVINAGDGANEHPTQTLLDLYTIKECHGSLDRLCIGLVGDLKYGRTIHSLIKALSLFDSIELFLLCEDGFDLPEALVGYINNQSTMKIQCVEDIETILPKIDVLYMTRLQKERLVDNTSLDYQLKHIINKEIINAYAKTNLAILHPLPRLKEIDISVDSLKQARYFQQASNGLYVRAALLKQLLIETI
ncbi:aspartate carbamoyltransferase [Thiotrichales bacterium 19S3-7]|nr:aspartate carbamoyltransferase [Thiotrichales bacterium 19S3-7]MCF6801436.1 aspartate carbamoyltransferase [Thiotrichales bacterium 19S3-11]